MKYFAGIGSRETPRNVYEQFVKIGHWLSQRGYVLRSGGADGADMAFETGAKLNPTHKKEIYLAWKGFNGNPSPLYAVNNDARVLAARFHPRWDTLKDSVKNLMARNCYQVLGYDLNTPVDFVVCWTPKGLGGGGTGQAIRIAKDYNIPVYDFGNPKSVDEFREFCKRLKNN